ncbi:MAG TPA: hypothetical protein VIU12_12210 [Chryseolinea sp.]
MKRTLSFALIALILFNNMGYHVFFLALQFHNDRTLIETLDDVTEIPSETVSIKIPIAIPYLTDSREYVRVDGVVEYKGESLRLVKQRLHRDTLEIVCIKDSQRNEANQAFITYARSLHDKARAGHHWKVAQPVKDFLATAVAISAAAEGWTMQILHSKYDSLLNPRYMASLIQPPERT